MPTPRQQLGQTAEQLAAQYLQQQGFTIVARNYRHGRAEVDLVACKDKLLVFVEVKARSSSQFGHPETFVSEQQQERLLTAAEEYIITHQWDDNIRFDIIGVYFQHGRHTLDHFEDAF